MTAGYLSQTACCPKGHCACPFVPPVARRFCEVRIVQGGKVSDRDLDPGGIRRSLDFPRIGVCRSVLAPAVKRGTSSSSAWPYPKKRRGPGAGLPPGCPIRSGHPLAGWYRCRIAPPGQPTLRVMLLLRFVTVVHLLSVQATVLYQKHASCARNKLPRQVTNQRAGTAFAPEGADSTTACVVTRPAQACTTARPLRNA